MVFSPCFPSVLVALYYGVLSLHLLVPLGLLEAVYFFLVHSSIVFVFWWCVWQRLGTMSDMSDSSSIRIVGGASGSIPMEIYSSPITTVKFDDTNYLTWSQSVKISIRGCGKWGYISGDTKAPKRDDPTYVKWEVDDSLVMS